MITSRYNSLVSPHILLDTIVTTRRKAESFPAQGEVPARMHAPQQYSRDEVEDVNLLHLSDPMSPIHIKL